MSSPFGERIKTLRRAKNMLQVELSQAMGVTQATISNWETGRHITMNDDQLARLAQILDVPANQLRDLIPTEGVMIPILGVVGAGPGGIDEMEGEYLSVSEVFRDCVAYTVRGSSMIDDAILDGDRIIVRANDAPPPGSVVVAYVDGNGTVVKRLDANGYLRSRGPDRWIHRLDDGDRIYGILVGVVRLIA